MARASKGEPPRIRANPGERHKVHSRTSAVAILVTALVIPLAALALAFTTIDVDLGPLSVQGTAAQGINAKGDVVGYTIDAAGNSTGYLMDKHGNITTVDVPGAIGGPAPRGINAPGDIVGEYSDATTTHGFLRSKHGDVTTLDFPGALATSASGINSPGEIVGFFTDANGTDHGFLFSPGHGKKPGTYQQIDYAPSSGVFGTRAYGISDQGDIVGIYITADTAHGFLQHHGAFTTVEPPGADGSQARGINSRGDIVGQWGTTGGPHGYLFSKGTYTTFDVPGTDANGATRPRGINERGVIVGNYFDSAGTTHGFEAQ